MTKKKGFSVRALEFHAKRMWQWSSVKRAIDIMKDLNLNTLIFHQNDIINHLVLPDAVYPLEGKTLVGSRKLFLGVRLCNIMNNRAYMQRVLYETKKAGINFFLQVKEIYPTSDIFEVYPEVLKPDGAICVTDPFWFYYLREKVQELLEVLPDIAGIIVSPGTDETPISILHNKCTCRRCQLTTPQEWLKKMIETMYKPLAEKGKTLVVRDFAKTPEDHRLLMSVLRECSKDIVVALKFVPQDYFHTFPDNPYIGSFRDNPQWVEFDVWGQFYGLGLFPCSIIEDMQKRMRYCYEKNVSGIMMRTDWECITESSIFTSFNLLNLIGGAILAQDIEADLDEIYKRWLEYGLFSPLHNESEVKEPVKPKSPKAYMNLRDFMRASWSVMEKTVYVRGAPLTMFGGFPPTLKDAFQAIDVRCRWDPNFFEKIEPTEENLKIIFEEKSKALEEVKHLPEILKVDELGLPPEMAEEIKVMLDLYQWYVKGWLACTQAIFLAKKALATKNLRDVEETRKALKMLAEYRENLINRLKDKSYNHLVYLMLNANFLSSLEADIRSSLEAIESSI